MSNHPVEPGTSPQADPAGPGERARDEAGHLAGEARAEGRHVAQEARAQAGEVAAEARHQARSLSDQAFEAFADTAGRQQERVGAGLRTLSEEFAALATGDPQSGVAADLVQSASDRLGGAARWLERDSQTVIDDVRRYARRNPITFLALCAGAGVLAGRLTRSLKDAPDTSPAEDRRSSGQLPAGGSPSTAPGPGVPSPQEQTVLATPSGSTPLAAGDPTAQPTWRE